MTVARTITALVAVSVLTVAGCSSDGSDAGDDRGEPTTTAVGPETTEARQRPDGPAPTVEEITGEGGVFLAAATASVDLDEAGYVEQEFAVAGTATSYEADELPGDGTYELTEGDQADYKTRVVVRRPEDGAKANGAVVVEWLNVSGGLDANPDYAFAAEELVRGGYTWVGVSAQLIGVEGGPTAVALPGTESLAGVGLKAFNADRYGDLSHPGDAYSYDIFTQVGRALRADDGTLLGDVEMDRMLAVGESQSGFTLTTYANGVQPLTEQFDGFLIHSRGGAAAPLRGSADVIDIAGAIAGEPTIIRADLDVPVLILESESDVLSFLNFYPARQPDTDRIRVWEVAGTAHADAHLLGPVAGLAGCPTDINAGPHHFVVKAALRSLDRWVANDELPPSGDPLTVDPDAEGGPAYVRDADGIVEGGIRTPQVDVPVDVLSGDPAAGASIACMLFGSTVPLPAATLGDRYESADDYLAQYEAAADAVIEAGFVLPEDREALMADADPTRIDS
ncbi:MAG: alpha/beta hydrolase domain-containing protein [Aquihabitans sp.]